MDDIGMPARARINANGRIVLPAEMRKALGVKPGDEVLLRVIDGEIHVYTLDHAAKRLQELARRADPSNRSWVDELIRERRREARREAREWNEGRSKAARAR